MTPTPREVPVWPHRASESGECTECSTVRFIVPWPCPSQQYLDGIVAALAEPETVREDDYGYAYEWSALSRALDAADDVMLSRGYTTGSYSNEQYAAALRRALLSGKEP